MLDPNSLWEKHKKKCSNKKKGKFLAIKRKRKIIWNETKSLEIMLFFWWSKILFVLAKVLFNVYNELYSCSLRYELLIGTERDMSGMEGRKSGVGGHLMIL